LKGKVIAGVVLSMNLLAFSLPSTDVFAAKNVLTQEKYNEKIGALEFKSGNLTKSSKADKETILFDYLEK